MSRVTHSEPGLPMLQFGSPFKLGMLPRGRDSGSFFCGRIVALGRWNLKMSWCKCPGVPRGQPPRDGR